MKNAIAIAKKELNIYFATPIAYVMFTLFVVIGSYFFLRLLGAYEQASLQYMRFNQPELVNRLNFQDVIFRSLFGNLGLILIFIIPFLTMRLIAEEKRQKTIELLYTTPVTPSQIVWGKYLAALGILACALLLTVTYPLLVQLVAKDATGVEWRSVGLGYLGLFLMGAAYMAIGLFISSLTESQVVAALITFVVLLMTWIIGWAATESEGWVREFISYLTAVSHLDSFGKGTLDLKDVVYFLSIIVLGLFATNRAVEAHRWS
jgi:gliding motility-associated transport system permease protein